MLALISSGAMAQGYTMHSFGYMGGQSNARLSSEDSVRITYSGGNVVAPGQFETILQDKVQVLTGFPGMVSYFPRVFDRELFISKGYFSDYVQLQWNIVGQQDRIERIKVFRKPLGSSGDSTLVASLAADNFTYRDEYAEKGQLYAYTIFAEGIADELRIPNINIMEGVGFAFPFGTASGRITYEGGTAVAGVQILAETDGNLGGKAVEMNGTDAYLEVEHRTDHDELLLHNGFTVQLWAKYTGTTRGALFSKGSEYELAYEPDNLSFTVGDVTLDMAYTAPVDGYFHVTAVYDPAVGITLYVQENDNHFETASAGIPTPLTENIEPIFFGRDAAGTEFYQGAMDELRIWNKALTEAAAKSNFSRYLAGQETGLAGYWKLNSGIGGGFYDFSRIGFEFNENHGVLRRAEWSQDIPGKSQLAYRGVTDANGNYVVRGFPYETSGSQYTFTPLFGVHEFEPTQQLRFVGDGSAIFNGLDFDDVSSFPVTGTIYYKNTPFPVEGASLFVDGKIAFTESGQAAATNTEGQFSVDVPIGFHYIEVRMTNHGFDEAGRFPPATEGNASPTYDFQKPESGLTFYDTTLVRMSGRVVGGPIESGKPLGFGLSTNNIGNATITMRPKKLKNLTFVEADSTIAITEEHFTNSTNFNVRDITISPDVESGEFSVLLPPEEFIVNSITTKNYTFDDSHHVGINLKSALNEQEVEIRQDTVSIKVGEEEVFTQAYTANDYDSVFTTTSRDSTFIVAVDTFKLDHRQDFILRVTPQITVADRKGNGIFGDSTFTYVNENIGQEIDLALIDRNATNVYNLGHPVFRERGQYSFEIALFEEYLDESDASSSVPVIDGEVSIVNELAIDNSATVLALNDKGKLNYTFTAGLPNIALDDNVGDSFTKSLSITAFSGNNGAIQTVWRSADPFKGIVLGGLPTGNNFVTTGPNEIITILRDPPGSRSSTYIEEGTSFTKASTISSSNNFSSSTDVSVAVGSKVKTVEGVGVAIVNETEVGVEASVGLSLELGFATENTSIETTKFTRTIRTSDDPGLVGSDGDIFVGYSTNIVYGLARNLTLIPSTDCLDPECLDTAIPNFKIGLENGLRLNPEFETFFLLSQFTIENITVPGLKAIRDDFLVYSSNPDTINPLNEPIYVSLVSPDDERFGSNNFDKLWGAEAKEELGTGPSYVIKLPQSYIDEGKSVRDTLVFYNQQISDWEYWLAHNERIKLNSPTAKNITFDGNVTLEESQETTIQEESTREITMVLDANIGIKAEASTSLYGVAFGMEVSQSFGYQNSFGQSETVTEENSTTYGFTLDDGDLGDTYTVDVKNAADGFGPVFSTRGGATSCPYEGEVVTKYFEPGSLLSAATAQREIPSLQVVASVVSGVPENRAAVFSIQLTNNSETSEAFEMKLDLIDATNPYGAIIAIDGAPLGNGLVFNVPAGATLNKTLTLRQGRPDITDYENIKLQLASLCQADPNDNLEDIVDVVEISAFFVPGCSDVALALPSDQWVLNSRVPVENVVGVKISDYDLNFDNFERIDFQYRPANSSQWITDMRFYNDQQVDQPTFDALNDPKQFILGNDINYNFDMSSLPDRQYQIRAITRCILGPGSEVTTPSDILNGTKDIKRPKLFGNPQPADGILSANDEILIQFDETIEAGLLGAADISVRGVLNSAEINHNASVKFDGTTGYMRVANGLNLDSRSFTVEFWAKRQGFGTEEVLYSKGFTATDVMEFGFTSGNNIFVNVGGNALTSSSTFTDAGWNHYALVYNAGTETISVYMNDQYALDAVASPGTFTGEGDIVIGKSQIVDNKHFTGNIHDLRIWTKFRQIGDVYARMSATMTGSEIGLVGYWPMSEAYGDIAFDQARSRHALVFAGWEVSPAGKAYAFDGVDDLVTITTGSTVIVTPEMDYTIEFWFKGTAGQTNVTLFSSGRGDGTDVYNASENSVAVGFDANGALYVTNDGEQLKVTGADYLDNNWHHFAFSLLRRSNANLFVDGIQKATVASTEFGGLSGAQMWIGARGYLPNEADITLDQHFEGFVDEFRVWNVGRKQSQIELNRNSRLIGDEMGLIGYYPFEFYENVSGIKILNPTLADQWENPYGDNAGTATSQGGASFSDDTPNIKDARPVESVPFTWAVNDDKIIITPAKSFEALIEQTILEITVQNIEDLNENRLASPATWTAFVDRNQLKWDTELITARKEVYEPFTFSVNISNRGGTESSYSLENIPAWLTANPNTGVLAPLSSQTVKFTVNQGLNTGYYLEDIFLTSDFGYDEKLTVDLQVFAPAPEWDVDPADFQYSMSVVAELEIDGRKSSDVNDRVAAFVNDTLRGSGYIEYLSSLDLYEVFLDIYSNVESGETVELRVWDANEGVEYRNALPAITFSSNDLKGTPSAPELIQAGDFVVQNVTFAKGWNWASVQVASDQLTNINTLMENVSGRTGDQIKALDAFDIYTDGIGWSGTISSTGGLNNGEMYLFKVQNGGSIAVIGENADPNTAISINTGWNWLGYIPRFNMSLNEAFAFFNPVQGDLIKSQSAFAVYDANLGWVGSLKNMEPGEGYLFKSANAGSLTYPEKSSLSAARGQENLITEFENLDRHKYSYSMTVIASVAMNENVILAAYVGDELRGVMEPVMMNETDRRYFLTVYAANSGEELVFRAVDLQNDGQVVELKESLTFSVNASIGTTAEPFEFNSSVLGSELANEIMLYPNPFESLMTVSIPDTGTQPEVSLTDLTGKVIGVLIPERANGENWSVEIKARELELSSGVYLLRIVRGDEVSALRIIKR